MNKQKADDEYYEYDPDKIPECPPTRGQLEAQLWSKIQCGREVTQDLRKHSKKVRGYIIELLTRESWKYLGYRSLRDYCRKKLPQIPYSQVIRIQKAMAMHAKLEPDLEYGDIPESVYYRLARIPEKKRRSVWMYAKHLAGTTWSMRPKHITVAYYIKEMMLMAHCDKTPNLRYAAMIHFAAYDLVHTKHISEVKKS